MRKVYAATWWKSDGNREISMCQGLEADTQLIHLRKIRGQYGQNMGCEGNNGKS